MSRYKIKYTFIDDIVADTKEKAIEIFENFIYNTEDYNPDIVTIEENEDDIPYRERKEKKNEQV